MTRGVWIGAVAGALTLAVMAWLVLQTTTPLQSGVTAVPSLPTPPIGRPSGATGASGRPDAAQASADASVARPGAAAVNLGNGVQTAPWMSDGASAPLPGAASPGIAIGKAGAPTIDQIQQRLQRIAASGQPSIRELDAVLADLQRNQGSNVVAGVNLQALRDNLGRSERIQQLAQQIQGIAAAPGPDSAARLQPLVAEIQRLQSGMEGAVAGNAANAAAAGGGVR